jgi:hypothetical protein
MTYSNQSEIKYSELNVDLILEEQVIDFMESNMLYLIFIPCIFHNTILTIKPYISIYYIGISYMWFQTWAFQ